MIVVVVLAGGAGARGRLGGSGLRVIRQWERGVVLRFGQVHPSVRGPGLTRITPIGTGSAR
jgi:regulator of protease activity HflC (stomatin/prohibitin superfamily)